jgi:hypothetical protein
MKEVYFSIKKAGRLIGRSARLSHLKRRRSWEFCYDFNVIRAVLMDFFLKGPLLSHRRAAFFGIPARLVIIDNDVMFVPRRHIIIP